MSGFAGFTTEFTDCTNAAVILEEMLQTMVHRGPASEFRYAGPGICAGIRSFYEQKCTSPIVHNNLAVFFDGEIYNKKELQLEVQASENVSNNTDNTRLHSKTIADEYAEISCEDLIAALYSCYGEKFVKKLRGMFALVIYDIDSGIVFGARDPFGMKPFYYAPIGNDLVFSSEIKAILKYPAYAPSFNDKALETYLSFQCSVLEETFFKGIYKLMPAHTFTFKSGHLETKCYWKPTFNPAAAANKSIEDCAAEINSALSKSVDAHKCTQCETGSFLAAGVDSNYVTALLGADKGFSVSFDYDKCDDVDYTNTLADILKVDNYSTHITTKQCWDAIPHIISSLEEPLGDISAIPQYFAYKNASNYVSVTLSGEGADELFGGCSIYSENIKQDNKKDAKSIIKNAILTCSKSLSDKKASYDYTKHRKLPLQMRYTGTNSGFTADELEKLLVRPSYCNNIYGATRSCYNNLPPTDDVTKMQYIDINFRLVNNNLLIADKLGMANSLEVRMPYLDYDVYKVASTLPSEYKVSSVNNKLALRIAAQQYLPEAVTRPKPAKRSTPIGAWIRNEKYYNEIKDLFTSDTSKKYFKTDVLMRYLNDHKAYKADYSGKIWTVYMFLLWYRIYFD